MRLIIILSLLLLPSLRLAYGDSGPFAPPQWQYREFHAPAELNHELITDICQAKDGSVWFSTKGGGITHIKDGRSTFYSIDQGLVSSYAVSMAEDAWGGIWTSTTKGISYIHEGNITNFTHENTPAIPDRSLDPIAIDSKGGVWSTSKYTGKFIHFIPQSLKNHQPEGTWESLDSSIPFERTVTQMFFDAEDTLWIAADYHGLLRRTASGDTRLWDWRKQPNPNPPVYDLAKMKDGSIWLCGDWYLIHFEKDQISSIIKTPYKLSAVAEAEGHLLVGTYTNGLFYLDGEDLKPITFSQEHITPYIECIRPYKDGSIWIGTREGAYRISKSSWQMMTQMPGGSIPRSRSLIKTPNGTLYTVDAEENLYQYTGLEWTKIAKLTGEKSDSSELRPHRLSAKDDKTLHYLNCIGFYEITLTPTVNVQSLPYPAKFMDTDNRQIVYISQQNEMWCGTYTGIFRWNGTSWEQISQPKQSVRDHIIHIFEPSPGILWFLGYGCIAEWKNGSLSPVPLPVSYTKNADEWSYLVYGIVHDNASWIASSRDGVLRFDGKQWNHYHQKDGLPDEGINTLYSAPDGALWAGSARNGLASFKDGRWITYGLKDGITNGQVDNFVQDNDGKLWVEIRYVGIASYTPRQRNPIAWIDSESTNLSPGESGVFSFDGRDTWNETKHEDMVFSWRIMNVQNQSAVTNWTPYSPIRTINSPRMKPGTYQLQVRSQNKDRITSPEAAISQFTVLPYFWSTPQFLIPVCLSICIALLSLLFWYRKHIALRLSESRYRHLVEKDTLTIMINWDSAGHIIYYNECAERLSNSDSCTGKDFSAQTWITQNNPEYVPLFLQTWQKAIAAPDHPLECTLPICLQGNEIWITWFFRAVKPPNRLDTEIHAVGIDITQQVKTEKALNQEKMTFLNFCDILQIGLIHVNQNTRITYINPAIRNLIGMDNTDTKGKELLIPWCNPDAFTRFIHHILASGRPVSQPLEGYHINTKERFYIFASGLMKEDHIEILTLDYTEQKNLERKLAHASSREQERLGRELHDGLGQQLTALSFLGTILESQAQGENTSISTLVSELNNNIHTAIQHTRNLSKSLCPASLERDGLVSALQEMIAAYSKTYKTKIILPTATEPLPIPAEYTLNVYRIIKEACFNALKHSRANTISIEWFCDENAISVVITDDGIGITEEVLKQSTGLGRNIMEYHAQLFGGTIHIGNNTMGGARISCSIPIHHYDSILTARR